MVTSLNNIEKEENDLKSFKKYFEREVKSLKISSLLLDINMHII